MASKIIMTRVPSEEKCSLSLQMIRQCETSRLVKDLIWATTSVENLLAKTILTTSNHSNTFPDANCFKSP